MIEYILFDLSEVCIRGIVGVEAGISRETGVNVGKIKQHLRGDKLIELFEGKMSEDEYWRRVIAEGRYTQPADFFKQTVRDYFRAEMPGTVDIVRGVKASSYPIGLLSDHVREWIAHIESVHPFIGQLFEARSYSFDSGYTKLVPQSFEHALAKLGANPQTTLFIDDSEKNLAVARSAGIGYTYQFTNAENLATALLHMGMRLNGRRE